MDGTHRLRMQIGVGHLADVHVKLALGVAAPTTVSESAFKACAWECVWAADLAQAAASGVDYAVTVAGVSAAVQVRQICYTNLDTSPSDVMYTAAFATWDALGYEPDRPPWIDDAGVHFPTTNADD